MKQIYFLLTVLFFVIMVFESCKKDSATLDNNTLLIANSNKDTISSSASIVGIWKILKDSFFVVDAPAFFKTHDSSYIGVATDYYNFRQDGSLYIKEGNVSDTLAYEILPNNQVNFIYNTYITITDSVGNSIQTKYKKAFTITTLIETNLTMSSNISSDILSPEGYFANKLKLTK